MLTTLDPQLEVTMTTWPRGVRLGGETDLATLPILETALETAAGASTGDVVVDLTDLRFIDAGGVRALAETASRLREARRRLVLLAPGRTARRIIDLSGWGHLFTLA